MPGKSFAPQALREFAAKLLTRAGLGAESSAAIADILVWADLRGVGSHGFQRLAQAVGFVTNGVIDPTGVPEVARAAGALTLVEANRSPGPVAVGFALDRVIASAEAHGVGWAIVRNTTHTGAIGYYVEKLASCGKIGMAMVSGPPLMAYHGAREASLSTSPIAIGVPRKGHPPLVLDMATSVVANGRLQKAKAEGETIPSDWALTKDGAVTTDPNEAAVILPLGGPKGAGLGLMFECLNSVLAGAPLLTRMLGPQAKRWHAQNATLIAIDIAQLLPLDEFEAGIDDLATTIKGLTPREGFDDIRLPGERGAQSLIQKKQAGITYSDKLLATLADVAKTYDMVLPDAQDVG